MKKILIIDDSALMRKVISDIIKSQPGKYVTETAANGEIAVKMLKMGKKIDLILLDMNMPKMNGIDFLEYLAENNITIPVLVVSSTASKSAKETILSLELGAYDFIKKPDGSQEALAADFREQLLEKVACAFVIRSVDIERPKIKPRVPTSKPVSPPKATVPVTGRRTAAGKGNIIFIASSTGGPRALQSVIPFIPKNVGCPVVVVQHMPAGFTASLASRLDEMSLCKVVEASDGDVLQNGVVYIAKGGYQLSIAQTGAQEHRLLERKDAPRNGLRPCADIFLESLLDSGYRKFYCAVLTGMGSDGTEGLIQLKRMKDVYTVGQDEESCVVYGMPRAAVKAGVVDEVTDLEDVADTLIAAMQQNGG